MEPKFFDNRLNIVKDDLVKTIREGDSVSIAAASFSMYAYQELQEQLDSIDEFRFIFTSQTFTKKRAPKEKREFYIPRLSRERNLFGTDLEIRLRNELTQKAIAQECANWIREKAKFKSFEGDENMGMTALTVSKHDDTVSYMPFPEFTTSELGVERSHSNYGVVTRPETATSKMLLETFDKAWEDPSLVDVTDAVIDSIQTMYQENAPELIYYMALFRIFNEFLDDISQDVLPNERTGFRESLSGESSMTSSVTRLLPS